MSENQFLVLCSLPNLTLNHHKETFNQLKELYSLAKQEKITTIYANSLEEAKSAIKQDCMLLFKNVQQVSSPTGELDLSHCHLTHLLIFNFFIENEKQIIFSSLQLHMNLLRWIPKSLFTGTLLGSLRELNLSQNQLKSLPNAIGNLSNLQELHLADNKLSELPQSLGALSQLTVLDVSHNCLSSIPLEVIQGLPKLRQFFIQNNKFNVFNTKKWKQQPFPSLQQLCFQKWMTKQSLMLETSSNYTFPNLWQIQSFLKQTEKEELPVCITCKSPIFTLCSEQILYHLSVIVKCNQPIVTQAVCCSPYHISLFLRNKRHFTS